jgi:hypothetical protein
VLKEFEGTKLQNKKQQSKLKFGSICYLLFVYLYYLLLGKIIYLIYDWKFIYLALIWTVKSMCLYTGKNQCFIILMSNGWNLFYSVLGCVGQASNCFNFTVFGVL